MFKKMRGCKLSYRQQGLIRFICLNFELMPPELQKRITDLCDTYGGDYSHALWRVLASSDSIRRIAIDESVSESVLYRARLAVYNNFFQKKE